MATLKSINTIRKVGIAGAGLMGSSIAQCFKQYGYEVVLFDVSEEVIASCRANVLINQQALVDAKLLTAAESQHIIESLTYSTEIDCFADCDLIVEAISEKLSIKSVFYELLSQTVRSDCLIASNTSAIPISQLAAFVTYPERLVGMHWINPPHLIRLIEIIKGEQTSDDAVTCIAQIAQSLDKEAVVLNHDVKGFAFNRLQFALLREALHLVDSGAMSVADVDKVVKHGLGFRWACYGPFEVADFGGIDTFSLITEFLNADLADDKTGSETLAKMVVNNQLGLKSGEGFYQYENEEATLAIKRRDERFLALMQFMSRQKEAHQE